MEYRRARDQPETPGVPGYPGTLRAAERGQVRAKLPVGYVHDDAVDVVTDPPVSPESLPGRRRAGWHDRLLNPE